jgi:hypothetical protein
MMIPAAQDGGVRVRSNGNINTTTADGVYFEAFGASGVGAINTRNVLRLSGLTGAALALLQFVATQAQATGNLDVLGALTVAGQAVLTVAGGKAVSAAHADSADNATNAVTASNASELGGQAPSAFEAAGAAAAVSSALNSGSLAPLMIQGGSGGGAVGAAPGAVSFQPARVVMGNFSYGDVRGVGGLLRIPLGMTSVLGWGVIQNPADSGGQATASSPPYIATSSGGGNNGKAEIDWQFETGGGQGRVTVMYWALGN